MKVEKCLKFLTVTLVNLTCFFAAATIPLLKWVGWLNAENALEYFIAVPHDATTVCSIEH